MPIVGTPLIPPVSEPSPCAAASPTTPPSLVSCDTAGTVSPAVSRYYGKLVLARMRSARVRQGQRIQLRWQLLDEAGAPLDLTTCGFGSASSASSASAGIGGGFRVRVCETLSLGFGSYTPLADATVTVLNAATGEIEITLPGVTLSAGIYFVEVGVFEFFGDAAREFLRFSNVFYLIVDRGQFGGRPHGNGGPPTIAEIRLHLRDSGPEENLLLDRIKFDDAEIAAAISRPIDYWNEIPPPLSRRMTTQNFPFRYHWLEAIAANLFKLAAEQFRSNHLTYSAAGVQVDDQNKEPNYEQAAARRDAEWKAFVRHKKAALNLDDCWGSVSSTYGRAYGWR